MKALATALTVLGVLLAGCRTSPENHADCRELVGRVGGGAISRAAALTVRDYVRNNPDARAQIPSPDVPRKWWHEPIRDLHPARVYVHYFDLVIVLSESDKAELGLCVNTPGQSFLGGMMTNKAAELRAVYNPETEDPNTIFGEVSSYVKTK